MTVFKIDDTLRYANIPRTVRFSEDLFNRLNELAKNSNISFNLLVLQCCKYALDNLEGEER